MEKRNMSAIFLMVVFLCLLLAMVIQLLPLLEDIIIDHGDASSLVATVNALGWRGVPALLGLSALQVIIPIIPAPVVGVLAGLTYGILWGPVIFLCGIALGNLFVVISIRQLDTLIKPKAKPRTKPKKFPLKERLATIKRPEIVAFFFFMIPWLSSTGPYLFAETKVSLGKYVIAVVLGSLPATLMYVFLGDRISGGNYTAAIVMGVIVLVALLIILPFRKKIMDKIIQEGDA